MEEKQLVARALEARKRAYAPYSGFFVGAALLGENGRVYTGANIECAAFGAGLCAERAAVASAAADGCLAFKLLAVAGNGEEICVPCGICRQLLWEFAPDLEILCANEKGVYEKLSLKTLLPRAFSDFRPEGGEK